MSMFRSRNTSKLLLAVALCLGLSQPSLAADADATQPRAKAPTRAHTLTKTRTPAKMKAGPKAKPEPKVKAEPKPTAPRLSAAEILRRHVSARGGREAWRAVQALSMTGKMEAGTADSIARSVSVTEGAKRKGRREVTPPPRADGAAKQVELPFTLAEQRPNKSRLEIQFAGKTAVQVYDGTNGWKVRPYLNRKDVEPFTPEEAKAEAQGSGLADPLIDAAAHGTKVELAAVERLEGRDVYKLKVTTKAGTTRSVWIDARTFLDVKVEGAPRRMDGKLHSVFVYQRDFRSVQGVKLPFVLETVVDGYPQTHKIFVEKVAVNPKLGAATFAKPKA